MNNFLKNLNSFQDKVIDTLLEYKGQKIFIRGNKFTGKSVLSRKLFDKVTDDIVMYNTGCNPKLMNKVLKNLKEKINKYDNKNITIILDESYNDELLDFIKDKNIGCYIMTNDKSINKDNFLVFNYYNFYTSFINNEIGKYLNIHQILSNNINFDKEHDKLRHLSTKTTLYIKEKNKIEEYEMELRE